MTIRKTYRGKQIDMGALQRQNEKTTAVGNMSVNAKGDVLGTGGKVVEPANSRSRTHYNTTRTTVNTNGSLKSAPSTEEKQVFDETNKKETATPTETASRTTTSTKSSKKQSREVELENGDIVIGQETNDSENS